MTFTTYLDRIVIRGSFATIGLSMIAFCQLQLHQLTPSLWRLVGSFTCLALWCMPGRLRKRRTGKVGSVYDIRYKANKLQ